jgi:hypothetical protein
VPGRTGLRLAAWRTSKYGEQQHELAAVVGLQESGQEALLSLRKRAAVKEPGNGQLYLQHRQYL